MKTPAYIVMILCSIGLFSADVTADVYKSVSSDGTVVYTNTPLKKSDRMMYKSTKKKSVPVEEKSSVSVSPATIEEKTGEKLAENAGKKSIVRTSLKKETVSARKSAYTDIVEEKAKKHNVDPKLVKSVIRAESNWNSHAISPKGAMGLMQLMPQTAQLMGVGNAFDPEENIEGGVKYLRYLLGRFNGNLTLALAAYNAGPKAVERKGGVPGIPETVNYVQKVMGDYSGIAPIDFVPLTSQTLIRKVTLKDGSTLYTNISSAKSGTY